MTLVLLWRVPQRGITTRWRGPAGLAPIVQSSPLVPVAAVVGPPGPAGSATSTAFPLLAVGADATLPVPDRGIGSPAWSTLLDQPVIWDGVAWRTFGRFCPSAAAMPDWVPAGALLFADFANGNYWRKDIGLCALTDIMEDDVDWWLGFDGPGQIAAVVPGVGLTTGPTTTSYSQHGACFLTPASFSAVFDGGICVVGEATGASDAPLAGLNSFGADVSLATQPGWQPTVDCTIANVAEDRGISQAYFGSNWDIYNDPVAFPSPTTMKFVVNYDVATSTWTGAVNGIAITPLTRVLDVSAINKLLVGASAGGTGNSVTGTIKSFYCVPINSLDQAGLNALTGTAYDLDFRGALPPGATLTRASLGAATDSSGTLRFAGNDVARFDYDPVTHILRGLLIEPAATNRVSRSQELGTSWADIATVTADQIAAPDGTNSADKLTAIATAANQAVYQPLTATAGGDSLSLYAKQGTCQFLSITNNGGGDSWAQFDLAAGTVAFTGGCTGSIQDAGNGWYRCSVRNTTTPSAFFLIQLLDAPFDGSTWNSSSVTAGAYLYAWGAQLEHSPSESSYVATAASSATRAADALSFTVPSGKSVAHCTCEGGSIDIAVSAGPSTLTAADFGGPVRLQGITFS